MAKSKLILESILAAGLIFGAPASAISASKLDYVIKVANHDRDKNEVEKFNQSLKLKGYMPQTEITHLIDGATLYYSIFEVKTGSDKNKIGMSLSEKTGAYCEPVEKRIFYDEKEIRGTINGFMKAIISEDADKAYSFFTENSYTIDDKKNVTKKMLQESFRKHDYKKFRLDEIIYENSANIYSYNETKERFAGEKEALQKLNMKNNDYLVELTFKKGFIFDKWGFLFRKINDNWKIIAFN